MRILGGVTFLRIDTVTLDMEVTKMRLKLMMKVFTIKLVTARAEQIPSICRKTGFSFHKPEMKIALFLSFATVNNLSPLVITHMTFHFNRDIELSA
jgi:hypothetical protein